MGYQTLMKSITLAATNHQLAYSIPTIRRETTMVKTEPFQIAANNIENELSKYIKYYDSKILEWINE